MRMLFALLLFLAGTAVDVDAASGRACRRSCGDAISASCEGLGRRAFKRCRRDLIKRCKQLGAGVCARATTTTTTTSTTTLPPVCQPSETNCGSYCCAASYPVCATNGDRWCCPADFPVYCNDTRRYCCGAEFTCSGDGRCVVPE